MTSSSTVGFPQAEVAQEAGISPVVYGRIERGVMLPAVPMSRKIALALRISSDVLLGIGSKEVARTMNERAPEAELSPELRKLVRMLRTWPDGKVKLLARLARVLNPSSVTVEFAKESNSEADE